MSDDWNAVALSKDEIVIRRANTCPEVVKFLSQTSTDSAELRRARTHKSATSAEASSKWQSGHLEIFERPPHLKSVRYTSSKKAHNSKIAALNDTLEDSLSKLPKNFKPIHGLLLISFLTLCWMLITTFSAPPLGANSGPDGEMCKGAPTEGHLCLCPRETVCATKWHEVIFLAFARASAYFDYPMYLILFVSKCHNLRGAAYGTHLKEWLPLDDMHHLHTFAGTFVSFEAGRV